MPGGNQPIENKTGSKHSALRMSPTAASYRSNHETRRELLTNIEVAYSVPSFTVKHLRNQLQDACGDPEPDFEDERQAWVRR